MVASGAFLSVCVIATSGHSRCAVSHVQDAPRRDARLLLRAGIILLAVSLINGFLIASMPLRRLALSAHLVGLMGSMFLIALSACWPALVWTPRVSRAAALAALYGFCGGWAVYCLAAATGTGGMFPIASGQARGIAALEGLTSGALLTIAVALFLLCALVLKGSKRSGVADD